MDYVILSGARRKEQRWDMAENEQIVTEEKADIKRLSADPMFKLEHDTTDKTKVIIAMPNQSSSANISFMISPGYNFTF